MGNLASKQMINMTSHSDLFLSREELEEEGWELRWKCILAGSEEAFLAICTRPSYASPIRPPLRHI